MLLQIRTSPARYELQITHAKLEWKVRNAELHIRQKPPLVKIDTEQPVLDIDQYQCFAESGLKNNLDQAREYAQKGYRNVLQYIAKEAREGDAMAKIGHKANIMLDIIKRDARTMHEFGMGTMPKSRPTVELIGGTLTLEAENNNGPGEINGVSGTYIPWDIEYKYTPWDVKIIMLSYGSVDIKYVGNNVDTYI